MLTINVTPDPRILEVITHNPMPPISALCELIDNSIDSFDVAKQNSIEIENPLIDISLPSRAEIEGGIGRFVIRDNGPGLSKEEANDALKAGFSGHVKIGMLGLFGMGFNISTGKFGKKTVFKTSRKEDDKIFCVTIDLPQLCKEQTFNVPVEEIPKPVADYSGVEVEISGWWEEGTPNYGFIKKLVHIGAPKLREQIGRRYSTLLRKKLQIKVKNGKCPVFHHCVWDVKRFVERRGYGRIRAREDFKETLRTEKRCYNCGNPVYAENDTCDSCGPEGNVKTRECEIRGWVGIQRFDDTDKFGIDFIRNGRAILIDEKDAVFTWTPEATGEKIKEYPVDGIYGRIVGEVHVDHVPTDFTKTDFQRMSSEWTEVIKFLRGESSILPMTQQKYDEPENNSPVYKLFQGYRKVRRAGRTDMYMGYWDEDKNKPERSSREEVQEFYEKFLRNETGYGPNDDSEWWKLVERADIKPTPEMKGCPECGTQNLKDSDRCQACNHILISKKCVSCEKEIFKSELHCPHCGANQEPKEDEEWPCRSCFRRNPPEADQCRRCGHPRGVEDSLKIEFLKENSAIVEKLSNHNLSIELPGDIAMTPIKLITYYVNNNVILERDDFNIPAVIHSIANEMHVFIDQTHHLFNKYQDRHEDVISLEIAKWILLNYQSRISDHCRPLMSLSNLYYLIHSEVWGERLELDKEAVLREVKEFFDTVKDYLPDLLADDASSIYEDLEGNDKSRIIEQLQRNNLLHRHREVLENGEYLRYLPEDLVIEVFKKYPYKFLDGKFWKDPYEALEADIPDAVTLQKIQSGIAGKYQRCFEDMLTFSEYRDPNTNYVRKTNHTLLMVREHLVCHV